MVFRNRLEYAGIPVFRRKCSCIEFSVTAIQYDINRFGSHAIAVVVIVPFLDNGNIHSCRAVFIRQNKYIITSLFNHITVAGHGIFCKRIFDLRALVEELGQFQECMFPVVCCRDGCRIPFSITACQNDRDRIRTVTVLIFSVCPDFRNIHIDSLRDMRVGYSECISAAANIIRITINSGFCQCIRDFLTVLIYRQTLKYNISPCIILVYRLFLFTAIRTMKCIGDSIRANAIPVIFITPYKCYCAHSRFGIVFIDELESVFRLHDTGFIARCIRFFHIIRNDITMVALRQIFECGCPAVILIESSSLRYRIASRQCYRYGCGTNTILIFVVFPSLSDSLENRFGNMRVVYLEDIIAETLYLRGIAVNRNRFYGIINKLTILPILHKVIAGIMPVTGGMQRHFMPVSVGANNDCCHLSRTNTILVILIVPYLCNVNDGMVGCMCVRDCEMLSILRHFYRIDVRGNFIFSQCVCDIFAAVKHWNTLECCCIPIIDCCHLFSVL